MSESTLMAHSGAQFVDESLVRAVKPPPKEGRWYPISHGAMLDAIMDSLASFNLKPVKTQYALSHGGRRFFGVVDVKGKGTTMDDVGLVLGLRHSMDKSFAAGVCFGGRVFVCDNLCFSGEVNIARKHTKFILRDFPRDVRAAVQRYPEFLDTQNRLYASLRSVTPDGERDAPYYIDDDAAKKGMDSIQRSAHDIVVCAMKRNAISSSGIGRVLDLWENPTHEEFKPRTAWSLFNAFTEYMKEYQLRNPIEAADRTQRLTALFADRYGNLN